MARRSASQTERPQEKPTLPCRHLHLGCPASRNVRNKCLLFRAPNLWYFSYGGLSNKYTVFYKHHTQKLVANKYMLDGWLRKENMSSINSCLQSCPPPHPAAPRGVRIIFTQLQSVPWSAGSTAGPSQGLVYSPHT